MIRVTLPLLALAACGAAETNYPRLAKECVNKQVPSGQKVSAERARQVVQNCQPEIDRWAFEGLRRLLGSEFDPKKPSVVQEYKDRKEVIEEIGPRKVVM